MDQQYSGRVDGVAGAGAGIAASGTIEIAGKTVHRLGFGAVRVVGPASGASRPTAASRSGCRWRARGSPAWPRRDDERCTAHG